MALRLNRITDICRVHRAVETQQGCCPLLLFYTQDLVARGNINYDREYKKAEIVHFQLVAYCGGHTSDQRLYSEFLALVRVAVGKCFVRAFDYAHICTWADRGSKQI